MGTQVAFSMHSLAFFCTPHGASGKHKVGRKKNAGNLVFEDPNNKPVAAKASHNRRVPVKCLALSIFGLRLLETKHNVPHIVNKQKEELSHSGKPEVNVPL